MSLETDKIQGKEAQTLLDMPIFKEAWKAAEEGIQAKRRKCSVTDTDLAVRLVIAEQTLYAVKGYIEQIVVTGKMAEIQVRQQEQEAERRGLLSRIGFRR